MRPPLEIKNIMARITTRTITKIVPVCDDRDVLVILLRFLCAIGNILYSDFPVKNITIF